MPLNPLCPDRTHLCGFDINFTYPEVNGPFPALSYPVPSDPASPNNVNTASLMREKMLRVFSSESLKTLEQFSKREHAKDLQKRDLVREEKRQQWKRDLSGRGNGTLDSWYACFLLTELYGKFIHFNQRCVLTLGLDYMINFTVPWGTVSVLRIMFI